MEEDDDIWVVSEIEKKRDAWFKERAKPGMTFDEVYQLNDEAFRLFPRTERERLRKTAHLMSLPEFIL